MKAATAKIAMKALKAAKAAAPPKAVTMEDGKPLGFATRAA